MVTFNNEVDNTYGFQCAFLQLKNWPLALNPLQLAFILKAASLLKGLFAIAHTSRIYLINSVYV